MKVLLCEDMDKLGWLGDVVEVKSGYARNYLLPQGIAVLATKSNVKSLAEEKASRVEQRKAESEKLAELVSRVDGAEAVIAAKANEQGHLFGSVTARAIADNLRAQGFEVTDGMVSLAEHIKTTGTHEVGIKVSAELTSTVSVVVVPEDDKEIEPTDKDKTE